MGDGRARPGRRPTRRRWCWATTFGPTAISATAPPASPRSCTTSVCRAMAPAWWQPWCRTASSSSRRPRRPAALEARFLPVNWHLKSDELAWILEDSGAQVLVAHTTLKDFVDGAVAQAPGVSRAARWRRYEHVIADARSVADEGWLSPAFIFYTSGTTGRPKGVVHGGLTPDTMAHGAAGARRRCGASATTTCTCSRVRAYHAGPGGYAFTTLFTGGTVAILPAWDALGAAARRSTTGVHHDVHDAGALHPHPRGSRGRARRVRPVEPAADHPWWRAVPGRPSSAASSTRCPTPRCGSCTARAKAAPPASSPADWLARPGTVGLPWPGVEVRVLT